MASTVKTFDAKRLVGRQFGSATLLRELGRGNMAIVFVAFQHTLKRQIAVKVLPRNLLNTESANLFQQEAEATANLHHPNIIPVYEVGDTDEFLFLCMQLVQGAALSRFVKAVRRQLVPSKRIMPVASTLAIVLQVLDALGYAHQQEIVHRDIKPDNILLEKHTQRPLISDFGVAKLMRGDNTAGVGICGTPLYMAPEQITLDAVDGRADIYAVGAMLLNLLSPKLPLRPFDSQNALLRHKATRPEGIFSHPPSALNPRVHPDMDAIVARAMALHPRDRFGTCAEFSDALRKYRRNHLDA